MTAMSPTAKKFRDIIPTSSKEKENDELLYTVRSLVMVRNQLPAQVLIFIRVGSTNVQISRDCEVSTVQFDIVLREAKYDVNDCISSCVCACKFHVSHVVWGSQLQTLVGMAVHYHLRMSSVPRFDEVQNKSSTKVWFDGLTELSLLSLGFLYRVCHLEKEISYDSDMNRQEVLWSKTKYISKQCRYETLASIVTIKPSYFFTSTSLMEILCISRLTAVLLLTLTATSSGGDGGQQSGGRNMNVRYRLNYSDLYVEYFDTVVLPLTKMKDRYVDTVSFFYILKVKNWDNKMVRKTNKKEKRRKCSQLQVQFELTISLKKRHISKEYFWMRSSRFATTVNLVLSYIINETTLANFGRGYVYFSEKEKRERVLSFSDRSLKKEETKMTRSCKQKEIESPMKRAEADFVRQRQTFANASSNYREKRSYHHRPFISRHEASFLEDRSRAGGSQRGWDSNCNENERRDSSTTSTVKKRRGRGPKQMSGMVLATRT
ncbi:hypothetical protein WN51_06373 [Melipona quadrifasciata]|uniref:Uncharacterized protein n=1 Tax=Melipona quadrifasciata TaxID=166423 RepID=A0A0N0BK24_9HYME|nr:hypothetical protein WN51_06373 [Melipona quadrifasciata]